MALGGGRMITRDDIDTLARALDFVNVDLSHSGGWFYTTACLARIQDFNNPDPLGSFLKTLSDGFVKNIVFDVTSKPLRDMPLLMAPDKPYTRAIALWRMKVGV
jgi:hypothetical protein